MMLFMERAVRSKLNIYVFSILLLCNFIFSVLTWTVVLITIIVLHFNMVPFTL